MPKQDKSRVKQFLVVRSHTCAEGGKKPRLEAGLPASQNALQPPLPPSPDRSPPPPAVQLGVIFCCLESVKIAGFSFCMHNIHFPSKCVIWFGNYIYLQE